MMSSLIFLNNVKDGVDLSITITPDDTESRYFSKIVSKSELQEQACQMQNICRLQWISILYLSNLE